MSIFRVPINIAFPGSGSPGVNVWHIRTLADTGAPELSQANGLIGYIRTFYNSLVGYYPTSTALTLGTVVEEGTSREIVPTMAALGGTGTGSAPQLLAAVVTWRTTVASRRGRGRTFIGPLATACIQSDGTPDNTFKNNVIAAAVALVASSATLTNGAIGVWGYNAAKTPGQPRNPADGKVFRDFTGATMRDLFGSLRSRRD